jgi:hypothetical protein
VGDVKGDWDMTGSKSETASLDEATNYPQRKAQENIKSQAFTKQWRDRPLQTVNNWDLSIMASGWCSGLVIQDHIAAIR